LGTDTRPSASNTPASNVGSDADMCPMALHRPWAVEINEDLAATICSEAHVFSRHARTLPMRLQDVPTDDVIMTYKPCKQALQRHTTLHLHATATVPHRAADRSRARWAKDMTRQNRATLSYNPTGRGYAIDRSLRGKIDGAGHAMRCLRHHHLVPAFNALTSA
jgi:hypothetical protein